MNRPDVDEFAALWQDEPDPLEQAQMEAYARTARRRGKLLDLIDYAYWIWFLVIFVLGSFISTIPLTIAFAVPLMLGLTWITLRRRRLRQMTRAMSTSDRAAFLETSLRSARANLRRTIIGLASIPFVVPAAVFFKVSIKTGGSLPEVWEAFLVWAQSPRAPVAITLLLIVAAFTVRSLRRTKAEIHRLETLREGYQVEEELERKG